MLCRDDGRRGVERSSPKAEPVVDREDGGEGGEPKTLWADTLGEAGGVSMPVSIPRTRGLNSGVAGIEGLTMMRGFGISSVHPVWSGGTTLMSSFRSLSSSNSFRQACRLE